MSIGDGETHDKGRRVRVGVGVTQDAEIVAETRAPFAVVTHRLALAARLETCTAAAPSFMLSDSSADARAIVLRSSCAGGLPWY